MDLGSDSSRESSGIDQTNRINARDYYRNENRRSKLFVSFPVNFAPRYHSLSLVVSTMLPRSTCVDFYVAPELKKNEKRERKKPIDSCRFCRETFEFRLTRAENFVDERLLVESFVKGLQR